MRNAEIKEKRSKRALAKVLYLIAAVLAVVFVYMLYVNIMYINSYAASYGMMFSDMWQEAVQYVVTGSIAYFVYAVLVFSAGKMIMMLSKRPVYSKQQDNIPEQETAADTTDATEEFARLILSEIYMLKQDVEKAAEQKAEEKAENDAFAGRKKQYRKRRTI